MVERLDPLRSFGFRRRGDLQRVACGTVEISAEAATWRFRGYGSRRRRGYDVEILLSRGDAAAATRRLSGVAATPRLRRGTSVETGAGLDQSRNVAEAFGTTPAPRMHLEGAAKGSFSAARRPSPAPRRRTATAAPCRRRRIPSSPSLPSGSRPCARRRTNTCARALSTSRAKRRRPAVDDFCSAGTRRCGRLKRAAGRAS